ncbi:MAG: hypothetical protein MI784_12330 [Cytophagales bacterium]|nr:hypothetical protein [Cytophagales bacterium]
MKNNIFSFCTLLLLFCHFATAQHTNLPLNKEDYSLIDQLIISKGFNCATAFKPLQANELRKIFPSDSLPAFFSSNNSVSKGIWNAFYLNRKDFFYKKGREFEITANPVLYTTYGKSTGTTTFQNTKGVEISGTISEKVSFYSFLTDNQIRFPEYTTAWTKTHQAVPGEGFWKHFKENGYDYFSSRAHIGFQVLKPVNVQFGYDKFFIGDGYRSLFLSDETNHYLFLKLNTKFWRIQYTNLWAKLSSIPYGAYNDDGKPKESDKYLALHRLGLQLTPSLNIGLFESVVYGGLNSSGEAEGPQFEYMIPFAFMRSIERESAGLHSNAQMGLDWRWNVKKRLSFYGQFLLDELHLKLFKSNGWWAQKWGLQAGVKHFHAFGIDNLLLQAETNIVRPFTYSHRSNFSSYTHYGQYLGHPKGANFKEFIGIVRWPVLKKLQWTAKGIYTIGGLNENGKNWGADPLTSYEENRVKDFGNTNGQGIGYKEFFASSRLSYEFFTRMWIDLSYTFRRMETDEQIPTVVSGTNHWLRAGLRINIAPKEVLY